MNKFMKTAAIAAASSFAIAGSANAAIDVSILGDYNSYIAAGQTLVQDFDNPVAPGYSFSTTNPFFIGDGSAAGLYADPNSPGDYLAVQGDNTGNGSATLVALSQGFTDFSLYMGSPDDYNNITFTFLDNSTITLNGLGISEGDTLFPTDGDQGAAYRVNFNFGGQVAKSVMLQSIGQNAFESDGWAVSAVPEPATWAMMIAGFGLAGVAIRRRRNILAVA